jgi:WD40-like Beta Propeller Repeat
VPVSPFSAALELAVAAPAVLVCVAAAATVEAPSTAPPSAILAADLHNRLLVLDSSGRTIRLIPGPWSQRDGRIQGVDLASDGRRAFVAVYHSGRPDALYSVDLQKRTARQIGRGLSPAVSPSGNRLAYLRTRTRSDVKYRTALMIRNLATGREHAVQFGPHSAVGTPPDMVINCSPDGRYLALLGRSLVRVVNVQTRTKVEHGRAVRRLLAPAFLDDSTLVGVANCCIGPQRLVTVAVATSRRSRFATLRAPPEAMRALDANRLLVTTALHQLEIVSQKGNRRLREGVLAASSARRG